MSSIVQDGLYVIGFILLVILFFLFGYFFPHFCMHFFKEGKFGGMAINSGYFSKRCNHTEMDIQIFKRKQLRYIIILSIIAGVAVMLYLFSILFS
ncbi:MAG: hypothetical protein ACOZCL_09235 [Bacillota bacterium]